jgi:hypothetical protein
MIAEDVECSILREGHDGEGAEVVYFNWPNERLREPLRKLALANKQRKITDDELKQEIEAIETRLEYVQLWSYVSYVQNRIGEPTP